LSPEAVAADYDVGMTQLTAEIHADLLQQTLTALNLPASPDVDPWSQLQQASRGDVAKLLQQLEDGQSPAEWRRLPPEQIQRLRAALKALA
ncbi:MAG: hypothetical protein KBC57_14375, partial [Neisseriaceae bacterium]|nr:hypothetical protein [Neisseriaceae bacterium]